MYLVKILSGYSILYNESKKWIFYLYILTKRVYHKKIWSFNWVFSYIKINNIKPLAIFSLAKKDLYIILEFMSSIPTLL
jgi:hypothetical protein